MQLSDLDFDKTYTYADYLQWILGSRLGILTRPDYTVPINFGQ